MFGLFSTAYDAFPFSDQIVPSLESDKQRELNLFLAIENFDSQSNEMQQNSIQSIQQEEKIETIYSSIPFSRNADDQSESALSTNSCYSDSQTILVKTLNDEEIRLPIKFKEYNYEKNIGKGGYSSVVLVSDQFQNLFAAKVIPKGEMQNEEDSQLILNENLILCKIHHTNIIKYYESFTLKNSYDEEYFIIITEYCENGNLLNYVLDHDVDEMLLKRIFYEISKAIEYLHCHCGISHGDLKTENVLLDKNLKPKLCDFGFSKSFKISEEKRKFYTLYYAPPELLKPGNYNTFQADIWSLGIMFYALHKKSFPFICEESIQDQILNGEIKIDGSGTFYSLIKKCLQMKPEDRYTIKEILGDVYFVTK